MSENKKILVIDDDSGIGEMLKTLLEFNSFNVVVTENPDMAEELILGEDIDLVILDMLISGVNGTDVCARLKNDERTASVPILMMSALHEAGIRCVKAGADDFIAKPFEMEDLLEKIHQVLEKKQDAPS